jgi:hypothetical protein
LLGGFWDYRPKNKNNIGPPPVENDLHTNLSNDDKESISVTSPLDMMMQEDYFDDNPLTCDNNYLPGNMLQEEGTGFVVQPVSNQQLSM